VRVRGRDGAGEKKGHGPVRGLEDLGELLVDRDGHPELEPAERCWQGEGREWPGGLPFGSSASEGRGGRHHPAQHAQQRAERRAPPRLSPTGYPPPRSPPAPALRAIL